MKPSVYLVIYKDSNHAHAYYYGPFVSAAVASEFSTALPEPLKGGFKKFTATKPFTHNEASLASDLILASRQKAFAHA